jgi:hypothetical protein
MKTINVKLFSFPELSNSAKKHAISDLFDINTEDWYDCIYEDASSVGLIITGFDLDLNIISTRHEITMLESIDKVKAKHGKKCDTFILACDYLKKYQSEFRGELEKIEETYFHKLGVEYYRLLSQQYDYLTSDKEIIKTIEANDLYFTKDGKVYQEE